MTNAELVSRSEFHPWGRHSDALSGVTLFCDFDGPIMDVSERYYHTYCSGLADTQHHYQSLGQPLQLAPLSQEQFWRMKQDRTPDTEIAMRSGLEPSQVSWFLKRVKQIVNQDTLLAQDRLQAGVIWALHLLHSHGARLVLVTLRQRDQVKQILNQHHLNHLFAAVWGAGDRDAAYNNHAQHKADLLRQAIAHSLQGGYSANRAYMIGDTEADIIAGQTHGISTFAVTCGIRSRSYLEQFEPTHIHSDLLTIAHQLLNCPALDYRA
ncbi:HAD family hydrolase [Leptolyngbya sp. CCY15150]|uniref:HAD hydrolase-like protein n=1 Tax=Leptolyngbya sp. CCY15150 TaxID=2767772 RepID=UPI0019529883